MNPIIELMQNRRSNPKLTTPAPTRQQQEAMLACALRAPDHAGLKPWHYIFVQGEGLDKLGKLFHDAYLEHTKDSSPDKLERMLALPHRAPLVVVAIAKYSEHPKVPREEQIASCAAGIQQMMLAADSEGYACYWRTGPLATNPVLKKNLQLNSLDEIVGFLYIGTAQRDLSPKIAINSDSFADFWS
jgi:nitroreductase